MPDLPADGSRVRAMTFGNEDEEIAPKKVVGALLTRKVPVKVGEYVQCYVDGVQVDPESVRSMEPGERFSEPPVFNLTINNPAQPAPVVQMSERPPIVQLSDSPASVAALARLADATEDMAAATRRAADKPAPSPPLVEVDARPTIVLPEAKPDPAMTEALGKIAEAAEKIANKPLTRTVIEKDPATGEIIGKREVPEE